MKKLFLLSILALATTGAWAQTLKATSSASEVGTNERFQITYTLNTQGNNFKQPDFNGFEILSGPNQSISMQWINGQMSSSLSVSFVWRAPNTGTFTIEPATIQANGKTVTSNKVKIKVVKGKA